MRTLRRNPMFIKFPCTMPSDNPDTCIEIWQRIEISIRRSKNNCSEPTEATRYIFLPERTSATWTLPQNPDLNIKLIVDAMADLHVVFAIHTFFGSWNSDRFKTSLDGCCFVTLRHEFHE